MKRNIIFRLLKLFYLKLFRINDTPQRIALGLAIGIFLGILPGSGPVAALCAAFILRVNRASALIGSLLVNSWINIATFLLAIKIGSVIMHLDWQTVHMESLSIFNNFRIASLFKLPILKILYPLLIGYLVIAVISALIIYLTALSILKRIRLKKMTKKRLLILLCLLWIINGCAFIGKPGPAAQENILQLQQSINQKDTEINKLQDLIKIKDAQIEELRKKLSSFGVFE